jgi:hypothetical protein
VSDFAKLPTLACDGSPGAAALYALPLDGRIVFAACEAGALSGWLADPAAARRFARELLALTAEALGVERTHALDADAQEGE